VHVIPREELVRRNRELMAVLGEVLWDAAMALSGALSEDMCRAAAEGRRERGMSLFR